MQIIKTDFKGLFILEPKVFADQRGYFFESWNRDSLAAKGLNYDFIQDNESKSGHAVLRGLHYQAAPYTQAKLVRVVSGAVLDVVLDLRRGSPSFGKHLAIELSGENKRQLLVPRGFAHGFIVLSQETTFAYKCDNKYMPAYERGVRPDDPAMNIDWRIPAEQWQINARDAAFPCLKQAELLEC